MEQAWREARRGRGYEDGCVRVIGVKGTAHGHARALSCHALGCHAQRLLPRRRSRGESTLQDREDRPAAGTIGRRGWWIDLCCNEAEGKGAGSEGSRE